MAIAAAPLTANQSEFDFEGGPFAFGEVAVIEVRAEEELSRPFAVDVTLAPHEDHDVDAEAMLGQPGHLTIQCGDGSARHFNGVISDIETLEGSGPDDRRLRVRIVPKLWLLGLHKRSRTFHDMSIPDIVRRVFQEGAVDAREALSASYSKREFCVQYRESDLDFVSRLLEEAGIFYFFEHDQGSHTVVLGDAPSSFPVLGGGGAAAKVPFREPDRAVGSEQEFVLAFRARHEVRPTGVGLRDFNYLKPSLDLSAESTVQGKGPSYGPFEIVDYPGKYEDTASGKALAKVRLEELRHRALRNSGKSSARRLIPGSVFALEDHPVDALNGEYLIVSVQHHGWQPEVLRIAHLAAATVASSVEARAAVRVGEVAPVEAPSHRGYENAFICIRKGTPFRPERRTPRPIIAGAQTAIVMGPSADDISTDEHARIKVMFHWDRQLSDQERTSCWVRVSQTWAGSGWGALHLPRIGHEVLVEFLEGDPDRPIVTGCVYNGENPPPVPLPSDKTKSTLRSYSTPGGSGSNELMMEDASGGEKVYLHAQKDLEIVVEDGKTQEVRGNEKLTVEKDRAREIHGSQSLEVTGNDSSKVDGAQTVTVGGNRSVTVSKDHTESISGDQTISVDGALTLTVGKSATESVDKDKELNVGGAYSVSVEKALTEGIKGARTLNVAEANTELVEKASSLEVKKDYSLKVGESSKQEVAKTHTLEAKEIVLEAKEKFTIKVGSATLEISKSGDVTVKGSNISIKGSGDVVLKGSKVTAN